MIFQLEIKLLRSKKSVIDTGNKISLSNKRLILKNGIDTLAYGQYKCTCPDDDDDDL